MLHPLIDWQQAFVESYLRDQPREATLTGHPGEGKTVAAVNLLGRLLNEYNYQHAIIITPMVILKEQWQHMLLESTIGMSPSRLHVHNIQRVKDDLFAELEAIYKREKTFVIVDEAHRLAGWKQIKELFKPPMIEHNAASRILYVRTPLQEINGEPALEPFSDTEYIYDPVLLRRKLIQKEINRLSPSHAILEQFSKRLLTIDSLSWREFERLIAELLEADSYSIKLMNGTKDGGVDVIADKTDGAAGYFRTLWQAKKKTNKKVEIHLIRELADSVHEFKASKGIIVTSTFLTRGALERVERDKYILGKVDRNDLESWIERILFRQ
jgi:hypothetical protein